ncbi:PadR family transcriptional regulator [Cohnella faecalis]|uniref:PadR family transcriptional regulator n=1 Tax=Cohnella faecalis TaxID=2315694 RepID=A0A398CHT9_9BACL|nr:PadR family transcriptional regulator [Cohnella faecalis]RIE02816.1 PadR family transcriptional regulator [Cohnella faecalis]
MSTKLLILGLLMERDRHPYEIRQVIRERNWNVVFLIRDGSLYYAVDQMRDDGMIEAAEVIPVPGDNRPDKTVYRITEKGKAAFLKLLHAQFEQTAYPQHPFFPALPFVRHGDSQKVAESAAKQLEACECRIERMNAVLELKQQYLPRGSIHLMRGIIRFSEAERDWLKDVLADAESGGLEDAGMSFELLLKMQDEWKTK